MYNKRSKDELFTKCTICKCERLHAYWDFELECYIYLTDEPPICEQCLAEQGETMSSPVKNRDRKVVVNRGVREVVEG